MSFGYNHLAQLVVEIGVPTAGAAPPISIDCGGPPDGIVGTPYSHTFPVTGGTPPFTFSIIAGSLPPGLTLDVTTGIVSGTPTGAGTFAFTIEVDDSAAGSANVACSITIDPITVKITFRGVKRTRCVPAGLEVTAVPVAPSVKRAM